MKIVYKFAEDGSFAGEKVLNDFEDKNPETGEWILPENTTETPMELPYKEGSRPQWDGEAWVYYTPEPEAVPEISLDEAKHQKIIELKSIRDEKEVDVIEVNGVLYDYDDKSRDRIAIARQALEDAGVDGATITWTTADNDRVEVGIADFAAINAAAAKRSNELHILYNVLKAQVNECETKETVEKIEWAD